MAITAEEAVKAVEGSGGFVTQIAKKLGCTPRHVYNLRDKFKSVAEAIQNEREAMKDHAEGKLHELIKQGNVTAVIFYLKTQAKDRGYVERHEVAGRDGGPIEHAHRVKAEEFTDDELATIASRGRNGASEKAGGEA